MPAAGFRPCALPLIVAGGLPTGDNGAALDLRSIDSQRLPSLRLILIFLSWPILSGLGATLVELSIAAALAKVKGEDETEVLTLLS